MTWIKICGTTNLEDAVTAVEAGADALGFVFYEKSPRKIDTESAREIVARLPPGIGKVGVFVNESVETIRKTVVRAGLTAAQLHGDEGRKPAFTRALTADGSLTTFLVIPAGQMKTEDDLDWHESKQAGVSAVFFDSGTPQLPGGTGKTFNWKASRARIEEIGTDLNVVVAGGLTSANVADAIRALKPWGVDVASGVEARPGKKDPQKIRAFVDAVRQLEKHI